MTDGVLGSVVLHQPADWYDVLLDERGDARADMAAVLERTWPTCPPRLRDGSVDLLVRWREDMRARGAVGHGIVSTSTEEGAPVSWHVVTSVVPLPAAAEVDLSAVLAQLVRVTGRDVVHVETFPTDMGSGAGLVALPEVRPAAVGVPVPGTPVRLGMAAALSHAPGTTVGVLVVGLAVAPAQAAELAAVVAVMAGRSRLLLPPLPIGAEAGMRARVRRRPPR